MTGEMARREAGFAEQVHDALAHLYDPIYLEAHPLVAEAPSAAGTGNGAARVQGGARLRHWLLDAIQLLEPDAAVSPATAAWRGYRLLTLRYVEALSTDAVQAELGISRAQFFREHRRALDAVVSVLAGQRAGVAGADAGAFSALGRSVLPGAPAGAGLPEGTVTFLFTDVEGSTKLLEAHPAAYRTAMRRHHDLLAEAVGRHGGRVFETVGDAVYAAFEQATDALAAAVDGQLALDREPWGGVGSVRVRMGVHTGEVELQEGRYFGWPLNRCARLMGVAHGGQVVVSEATVALAKDALPAGVALRDMGLHRLKDLTLPERVYQVTHDALTQEFPPLRTLDALPHNLPAQSTPFLGREREVAAVRERLRRPAVRLLTLLGPGGTGKTRLGLQIAAEAVEEFPQGVYFVPLAGISDPSLVVSEVAKALGVEEAEGRSTMEAVIRQLRHRVALLVLDNCEHVVEGCVVAAEVLAACPHVKVLATSRVALRLAGEHEVQVPPLAVPLPEEWGSQGQPRSAANVERLSQYEAVRLFLDRAQAARAEFQISEENAPAVAEICYRLDGLPLAIELAAARVKLLPPHALLARLGHRLALLTSGARDVPARHQTLRAAIGWSYDLLSETERVLFRRLAVFAGGWDLEAVAAVCGAPEEELDAVEGVSSLLEKNLVRRDEARDGGGTSEPRYVMLETIREFGFESLRLSGEEAALRRLHTAHYEALLARAAQPIRRRDVESIAWVNRLVREHDNLRAALRWLIEQGEAERALAATPVLFQLWQQRGYYAEGMRWLEEVLALPGAQARTERRAAAVNHLAIMLGFQGRLRESAVAQEESIAISKEVGTPAALGMAARKLQYAGMQQMALGDMAAARARSLESTEMARSLGLKQELAWRLQDLALFARHEGDVQAAERYAAESRDAFEAMGRPHVGWGRAQMALALAALMRGHHDAARVLVGEALNLFRRLDPPHFIAGALSLLGTVELSAGNADSAREAWVDELAFRRARGEPLPIADSLVNMVMLAAASGEGERALRLLGAAEGIREALGTPRKHLYWGPVAGDLWERHVSGLQALPSAERLSAEGRAMGLDEAIAYALQS